MLRQRLAKMQVNMDNTRRLLDEERKINRELRCEKVDVASSRNELELFFLECVDEVKKEIAKRLDKQQLKQKQALARAERSTAPSTGGPTSGGNAREVDAGALGADGGSAAAGGARL